MPLLIKDKHPSNFSVGEANPPPKRQVVQSMSGFQVNKANQQLSYRN